MGINLLKLTLTQAWIEASTKGAVLLFTASELEYYSLRAQFSPFVAGIFGGMGGGIAQAYATVFFNVIVLMVDGNLYNYENCRDYSF
jgi:hypothetical protein